MLQYRIAVGILEIVGLNNPPNRSSDGIEVLRDQPSGMDPLFGVPGGSVEGTDRDSADTLRGTRGWQLNWILTPSCRGNIKSTSAECAMRQPISDRYGKVIDRLKR